MKKILMGLVFILGAFGLVAAMNTSKARDDVSRMEPRHVQAYKVARGDIQEIYERPGFVQAQQETLLSSKAVGILQNIQKREGDLIYKGELLAVIDGDEVRAKRALAQQSLQTRSDILEQTEDYYDQKVDEARSALEKSEKVHDQAKDDGSDDEVDLAQEDVQVAEEVLRSAKKMRDLQIEISKGNVDMARSQVSVALSGENATQIRAPFSGIVIARHLDEGSVVGPGVGVFTIARSQEKEVEISLLSHISSQIELDQVLQARGEDGDVFDVRVESISPQIDSRTRKAYMTLRLENTKDSYLGEYVDVLVPGEKRSDVLIMPEKALVQEYFDRSVYVVRDGQVEKHSIEIGISSDEYVEAILGVELGDRVVVVGNSNLRSGERVEIYE